ncbi:hypothetical protein [Larkinella sp.]|uniref:hypothetical protein n=1 Tax=Larkinella sp. TaxID=2034517 RepID=UPI003BA99386
MNEGLISDLNMKYLEAVALYEAEITSSSLPDLVSYTNLAFLYWEFAAEYYEFNIPQQIPEKWSLIGGERFPIIIKMGLEKYPLSAELHFWERYFPHRLFNSKFSQKDCESLLKKYKEDNSLIPYFFLYLFDQERYKENIVKLIEECNRLPTAKNLYIKSILTD